MPVSHARRDLSDPAHTLDVAHVETSAATSSQAAGAAVPWWIPRADGPRDEGLDPPLRTHLLQLVQYRWEPLIIVALQDGAARFSHLAQMVSDAAGVRVADGSLTRALRRLQNRDLVVRLPDADNAFAYNLTGVGYTLAPPMRTIVQAIAAAAQPGAR